MIIFPAEDCPQGSPYWHECRRGLPTASGFDRIFSGGGKLSRQAAAYAEELAHDVDNLSPTWFSESARNKPPNRAMVNGMAIEPEARRWYAYQADTDVRQVGFCLSDCGRFGCSPDGLLDPDGLLELKCPLLETHEGYLKKGELPNCYRPQVHGQLLVTGRAWCDFASYAGPPALLVRVEADDYTARLAEALEAFLGMYADVLRRLGLSERFAQQRQSVMQHHQGEH